MPGETLVEVVRGEFVESVHEVAACAVAADGMVLLARGDIDAPVFLRSIAKPFIAAAIVRAGAAERFALEDRELAIIAASHRGMPYHVAAVVSILIKIGLDASALQCGGQTPDPLHHNCSGKHAGILALALLLGADPASYLDPDHPAQQAIFQFYERVFGVSRARMPVAVDGCGIPVIALPLRHTARGFAVLAEPGGLAAADRAALEKVRTAMAAHPEYVGADGAFDTELMRAGGGLVAKSGAEGVFGVAIGSRGAGLAVKVLDGNGRATPPAVGAFLEALGVAAPLSGSLGSLVEPVLHNAAGRPVGRIRARF